MRVEATSKLLLGFTSGLAFGALLEKGGLARHETIMAQLRLRDRRVAAAMATAAAAGGVGIYALERAGLTKRSVKPLQPVAIVVGAALFGAGLATLGYCPGTGVAAAGAGRRDAVAGVLGMLAGAIAFTNVYPKLKPLLEAGNRGKLTLPQAIGRTNAG